MTQTFSCPACGAPNQPATGQTMMACVYCGANLTIPEHLRTTDQVRAEEMSPKRRPVSSPEIDAAEFIRKAQPVAIGAWNLFALWTWIRRLIPTCLILSIVFFVLCIALGALPFIMNSMR